VTRQPYAFGEWLTAEQRAQSGEISSSSNPL
jgi:hypothetical protein